MNAQKFILLLGVILALAVLTNGRILTSMERGFGWGIGREIAHSFFHRR
jgi:hypothetical protein